MKITAMKKWWISPGAKLIAWVTHWQSGEKKLFTFLNFLWNNKHKRICWTKQVVESISSLSSGNATDNINNYSINNNENNILAHSEIKKIKNNNTKTEWTWKHFIGFHVLTKTWWRIQALWTWLSCFLISVSSSFHWLGSKKNMCTCNLKYVWGTRRILFLYK